MLDLTGSPALDLAIGLAFIFFLLATLASAIHELIAAALGLRARTLEQGLRSMLEDPEKGWNLIDDFYDHDLIKSLYRTDPPKNVQPSGSIDELSEQATKARSAFATAKKRKAKRTAAAELERTTGEIALIVKDAQIQVLTAGNANQRKAEAELLRQKTAKLHAARAGGKNWAKATDKSARGFFRRTKGPSYISPRAFAAAVVDNLFPAVGAKTVFTEADEIASHLPPALALRLKPLIDEAQHDVEKLRTNLERWFDDTMARVSGWYKRKSQIILLVIGALLVPAINANALLIGETLWRDSAVRSAVVAQAQNAVATPTPTATPTGTATPAATSTPAATPSTTATAAATATATATPSAADNAKAAAEAVQEVQQVGVPLGWRGDAVPRHFWSWVTMFAGWLLTIGAISLGAPFWFDFLGRVARMRGAGKPETPLPATGSGKSHERVR